MKKLILLSLLSFILCSATTISNNEKITLASTADIEYVFSKCSSNDRTAYINIVSAATTVQFSIGEAIAVKHQGYATGTKIPVTFANGIRNIHLKGAINDIIVITY